MFKDIFRSLLDDKVRTFFCWVTFTITSMFIFLFFAIAMSDAIGVKVIEGTSDIPSVLMVVSVVLCSVEIVFANDFFIKNKSKELAVRFVCGSTYTSNALFLLMQTIVILLCALPLGIGGGFCLLPIINEILKSVLHSNIVITLNFQSLLCAFAVIAYVVFWTLILNLSFSYRNSAAQLLNPSSIKVPHTTNLKTSLSTKNIIGRIFSLLLWIGPVVLFYFSDSLMLLCVCVSLLGLIKVLDNIVFPLIEKIIRNNINDGVSLLSLGYFRYDLNVLRLNLLMYVISSAVLIALLAQTQNAGEQILITITFVAMNALLALSIMFKYLNEITERVKKFKTLSHLGFLIKTQKKIILKEVVGLFLYTIITTSFYLMNIFLSLIKGGLLQWNQLLSLWIGSVSPLIICGIVSYIYYIKTVIPKQK